MMIINPYHIMAYSTFWGGAQPHLEPWLKRNLSHLNGQIPIKAKAHGGLGGEGLVDLIDVDIFHLNPSLPKGSAEKWKPGHSD